MDEGTPEVSLMLGSQVIWWGQDDWANYMKFWHMGTQRKTYWTWTQAANRLNECHISIQLLFSWIHLRPPILCQKSNLSFRVPKSFEVVQKLNNRQTWVHLSELACWKTPFYVIHYYNMNKHTSCKSTEWSNNSETLLLLYYVWRH